MYMPIVTEFQNEVHAKKNEEVTGGKRGEYRSKDVQSGPIQSNPVKRERERKRGSGRWLLSKMWD